MEWRPLSLYPALRLSAHALSLSCSVVSLGIPSGAVALLGCVALGALDRQLALAVDRGGQAGEHPQEADDGSGGWRVGARPSVRGHPHQRKQLLQSELKGDAEEGRSAFT